MNFDELDFGDDGKAVAPLLSPETWRALNEGSVDDDGWLVFEGDNQLYLRPDGEFCVWEMGSPEHLGREAHGPFAISRQSWMMISGGILVRYRNLIEKQRMLLRLVAVVRGGRYLALAYSPMGETDMRLNHEPQVTTWLPLIDKRLWAQMRVGKYKDGGWRTREGKLRKLYRARDIRGQELWALRAEGEARRNESGPFTMPRDDWNRISCGNLVESKNAVEKDGLLLRIMAYTREGQKAALTYRPSGRDKYRPPKKEDLTHQFEDHITKD